MGERKGYWQRIGYSRRAEEYTVVTSIEGGDVFFIYYAFLLLLSGPAGAACPSIPPSLHRCLPPSALLPAKRTVTMASSTLRHVAVQGRRTFDRRIRGESDIMGGRDGAAALLLPARTGCGRWSFTPPPGS